MDGQKQTYEQFKADIFQWKDTHREEYRRFAKMMADGNEMQYLAVCRAMRYALSFCYHRESIFLSSLISAWFSSNTSLYWRPPK